jgi:hypothetical protein
MGTYVLLVQDCDNNSSTAHNSLYKGAKRRACFFDITKRISIQQTDGMIGTMHSASHSRVIIDNSRTKRIRMKQLYTPEKIQKEWLLHISFSLKVTSAT